MNMVRIAIAYHSGYGHTERVAEAIAEGIKTQKDTALSIIRVDKITEADWEALNLADAIIFGAPTYMGGVSGPFKTFLDQTSKYWMQNKWKDKIAAGFTNSSSYSGDKLNALMQMVVTAAQHGMIWVGQGELPPSKSGKDNYATPSEINRLGSSLGLMAQSNNDTPLVTPPAGDLETARIFGKRIVQITEKFLS